MRPKLSPPHAAPPPRQSHCSPLLHGERNPQAHEAGLPLAQILHAPQKLNESRTWSPTARPVTPLPTLSILAFPVPHQPFRPRAKISFPGRRREGSHSSTLVAEDTGERGPDLDRAVLDADVAVSRGGETKRQGSAHALGEEGTNEWQMPELIMRTRTSSYIGGGRRSKRPRSRRWGRGKAYLERIVDDNVAQDKVGADRVEHERLGLGGHVLERGRRSSVARSGLWSPPRVGERTVKLGEVSGVG